MMDQSVDLSYLSPEEYRKIIDVIKRDQDLKKQEDHRIFQLKAEIQRLRKRGIIKQGSLDPTRTCARCLTELGRIINRGAVCSICRKKVCKTCRHYSEDGQQWVCLVCHKQIQLKAITGEWMKEYSRTASGRIKKGSSSSKSASDAISKSIKNTFRTSFLAQHQHSSSSSQSIEDDHEKADNDESATAVPVSSSSSFSVVKTIAKGFIPSRLPPIDSLPPKSPPPKSPKSPLSGSEHKSSTDKEDSPKLPPSPVLKVLQSAVDLVSSTGSGQSSRNDSPLEKHFEKQTVFRKVSNRMLDSSSSEEEEEEAVSEFGTKEELHKTNSSGSTPSPRTPNSCRILSSIAHNQATAFKFPPSSPINSRPSSYEKQSERQSSDEFSTMSSFRSRSTSSEFCDENISDPRLTPQPLPRSRRVSPLRKQRAIAEEVQESQRSSLEAEYGSCPSSATTSAPDSGVADCDFASSPKNFFTSSGMRRSSSGHEDAFGSEPAPAVRESVSSLSEGEAVIEKSTGYVFRKVTIKKRNSNSQAMQQQLQQHNSHVNTSTTCVDNSNASNHSHERPTDENSFRASPRRLRDRNRTASGGNDSDGGRAKQSGSGVPQISVSDYSESFSNRGSVASSAGESCERHDEDIEHVFAYHSRSQTSLSSFGARSESMSSVYSAAGGGRYGSVVVTGEILFCISYNYKAGAMEVYIRECRNLAPVDTKRNRSDPYVKVYLLPDRTKSGKRKTKVKKHTLNPVFEEVLKFYMTISEIETRTLWLSAWHSDNFGRNDFLGEVTLPLGHEVFETPGLKWYPLQERLEVSDNTYNYKGDIFLALKYMPPDTTSRRSKKSGSSTTGELHVLIKEAHNLMATRSNGTSDPFCKSYLLPDKTKSGKQKTPVIKKTCNPKWNHTFVFDELSTNDLRDRCLELTIWDYDKITSNDFLGGVRLSLGIGKHEGRAVDWMDSIGDEIALWQQMLDRPNMWVYGELHLRSSMQTRRS